MRDLKPATIGGIPCKAIARVEQEWLDVSLSIVVGEQMMPGRKSWRGVARFDRSADVPSTDGGPYRFRGVLMENGTGREVEGSVYITEVSRPIQQTSKREDGMGEPIGLMPCEVEFVGTGAFQEQS